MAKTYILEPTELSFSNGSYKFDTVSWSSDDISAFPENAVAQINDKILKYNSVGEGMNGATVCNFTENGTSDDLNNYSGDILCFNHTPAHTNPLSGVATPESNSINIIVDSERPTSTYTVSIYTETEDDGKFTPEKAGLPDMNVNFTYDNPTNNGIALITKAVMYETIQRLNDPESSMPEELKALVLDVLYNPGYAPMERLVRAVAYVQNLIDPYNIPEEDKSNFAVDFANDLERIAFAIRPGMFAKPNGGGGDNEGSDDEGGK